MSDGPFAIEAGVFGLGSNLPCGNLITGRLQSLETHPVHSFIEASVPFVLCTDNPQVHGVSLSDEYRLFVSATDRHDLIEGMYGTQMKYAFGK